VVGLTYAERAVPREALSDLSTDTELRVVFWGDSKTGLYEFFPDTANEDDGEYFTYSLPPYDATCFDKLQNGAETGIDCGGPCAPCIPVLSNELLSPISIDGISDDWTGIPGWSIQDNVNDTDVLDLFQEWVAHDSSHVYFLDQYQGTGVLDYHNNIFIDVNGAADGFRVVEDHYADFLVQGGLLFRFTGCAFNHWSWELISSIDAETVGSFSERRVLRSLIGDPDEIHIVYHTDGARCDRADYYPNQGLGYFVYRFGFRVIESNMRTVAALRDREENVERVRRESSTAAVEEQKTTDLLIFIGVAVAIVAVSVASTVLVVSKMSKRSRVDVPSSPTPAKRPPTSIRRFSAASAAGSASNTIKSALGMEVDRPFSPIDEIAEDGDALDLSFHASDYANCEPDFENL
jgi:hypothetical protein